MQDISIQETVNKLYNKIPKNVKLAAVATFIMGMLANIFVFTNKFVNHDDLMAEFIINTGFDITSGRWTWPVIRKICTYYDMPLIRGLVAMLLLSISVAMIVKLLGIKDNVFVLIVSALFATYPINACFFSYLAISEIYYFAIIFAVLGVFLVDKFKWAGPVLAAICICLSLATYQSFLALTIGIVFVMAFIDLLDKDFAFKKWFLKYTKYALTTILGFAFYWAGTKAVLKITGNSLRGYAGTDQMFNFNFSALVESINLTFGSQNSFYFTNQVYQHRLFGMVNKLLVVIMLAIVVSLIINKLREKKFVDAITVAVMTVISPVMLNLIYVMMNGKSGPHMLMKYSTILLFAFAVAMMQHINLINIVRLPVIKLIYQWVTVACVCVVVYYGTIISNQLYLRMYYNTNAIDSMTTTLVTRITEVDDFNVNEAVWFSGFNTFFNENYETTAPFSSELASYTWMGTDIYPWYSSSHIVRYIDFYHHLNLLASNNKGKEEQVKATQEYQEMPVYPNEGSVKRIDGLVVVKFANE